MAAQRPHGSRAGRPGDGAALCRCGRRRHHGPSAAGSAPHSPGRRAPTGQAPRQRGAQRGGQSLQRPHGPGLSRVPRPGGRSEAGPGHAGARYGSAADLRPWLADRPVCGSPGADHRALAGPGSARQPVRRSGLHGAGGDRQPRRPARRVVHGELCTGLRRGGCGWSDGGHDPPAVCGHGA